MQLDTRLPERIIDAIYDAALDPALWPDALLRISRTFGGMPAGIAYWNLEKGSIPIAYGVEYPDGIWDIAADFATPETNPTLAIAMKAALHEAVDQGAEIGMSNFRRLPIYEALYRPSRIMPMFGTVIARSETQFGGFALQRPDHWEEASPSALAMGERISAHLGRAVALASLSDGGEQRPGSFEAALSRFETPVLMLSGERHVIWASPAAEAILEARNGLARRHRKLIATDLTDQTRLARVFAAAMQGSDAALSVKADESGGMLVVRMAPLWRSQARSGARVLVHVSMPRARARFDAGEAAEIFRLSPAEARIACELCASTQPLAEVGAALGVSVNTAKTLLQRVYQKTDVHSRTELAILFASALRAHPIVRKQDILGH